jgi:signal transduction histidine kinase
VHARAVGGGLHIEVEDQGPGVAEQDQPHVFERFYRGRGADAALGSGLGLAIAQNLARLHGGDIALRCEAGRGSTFTLNLPAA